jgi:hypothetical protein
MAAKHEDKIVKDIIKRYGQALDLKATPYVILEIIRQFGPKVDGGVAASCLPPGGPPKKIRPAEILQEINTRVSDIKKLTGVLEKTLKSQSKR